MGRVIGVIIFFFLLSGCPKKNPVTPVNVEGKENYNIIFVVDISETRLALENQKNRDKVIIGEFIDFFENRQQDYLYNTKDKIRFIFLPHEINDATFDNSLLLDMSRIVDGKTGVKEKFDSLKTSINMQYSKKGAKFQNHDAWNFFANELPQLIEHENEGNRFINKMIVLSDGRLFFDNKMCDFVGANKSINTADFDDLYLKLIKLKSRYENELLMAIPDDSYYGNLDGLFLEISNNVDEKFPDKSDLLVSVINKWFEKLGISLDAKLAPVTMDIYKKILGDFIIKRSIKDKIKVAIQYAGDRYDMKLLPQTQMVSGLEGMYWKVDIRNSKTNKLVYFNPGEYRLDDCDINDSISEFWSKVVNVIKSAGYNYNDYRIFIRGSADKLGQNEFKKKIAGDVVNYNISFFPKVVGKKNIYTINSVCKNIGPFYTNNDLPEMRAYYLKDKIYELCDFDSLQILEGDVTGAESRYDRNVCLMLYLSNNLFKEKTVLK